MAATDNCFLHSGFSRDLHASLQSPMLQGAAEYCGMLEGEEAWEREEDDDDGELGPEDVVIAEVDDFRHELAKC